MQTSGHIDAGFGQGLQFPYQGRRVYDHPRPDHRVFARAQNSARDQLQDKAASVEDNGGAGVVPSRASRDVIERGGQIVLELAFAFGSPLRAPYDNRLHWQIAPAQILIPGAGNKMTKNSLDWSRRFPRH